MFAKHAPLLWAFAGGCLSGVGLICFWGGDAGKIAASNARDERPSPPYVARAEPASRAEPAARAENLEDRPVSPEPGTSLAEVLTRLEAAYRRELAAGGASDVDTREPAQSSVLLAAAEPNGASQVEPERTASAGGAAADRQLPPREDTTPPVANVPVANVPVANVPVASVPVAGAPISNVNVHVDNLHQGDVYQMAVVQYFQMLALSSQAGLMSQTGPQHPGRARRAPPLSTSRTSTSLGVSFSHGSLTRPADGFPFKDYPWGSVTPASALVR
jgi:hypothetical protein